jgi:hypothetical protein
MAVLTRDADDEEEVIKIDDVMDTFINKPGDIVLSGSFYFYGESKVFVSTPPLPSSST